MNWEIETNTYALLCIKKITNEDLLYSTGNPTQHSVMTCMGKNLKKSGDIYMYD